MASTQEVELLRRQLEELDAQMDEVRQQLTNAAMNASVTGITEVVRRMGQVVSKPRPEDMRVGKPEPYAYVKDFDDWGCTFNGYAATLESCLSILAESCRGIISYTSYSRTNDCIYNGYDNINLEPNAMNTIDTVAHMNMHYTQY